MATRLGLANGQHTAGIYSDMTVDGPEIGTLVIVVDRAKNLPNRRTMGKQDPYCAARLGKEAKKTDTDLRGGQTPRWDQELRFTVHDSPDYHNIKVSIFNDDKKTDLIGEAWVPLWDVVITPGGGRADAWHSLTYRGKYAGEVRLELSYYDSRVPEKLMTPHDSLKKKSPVKRRPLPAGPSQTVVPVFGPRTMGYSRGSTVFLDNDGNPTGPPPEQEQYSDAEQLQPDFLPQIPARQGHRLSSPHPRENVPASAPPIMDHPYATGSLAHSQSTPNFHGYPHHREASPAYGGYGSNMDIPEYDSFASGAEAEHDQWDANTVAPLHYDQQRSWEHSSQFDHAELPPLPPSHNNTPQHRHHSHDQQFVVSSVSPLQSIERTYAGSSVVSSRPTSEYHTPARGASGIQTLARDIPSPHGHAHPSSGANSPFSRSVGSSPAGPVTHNYLPHPGMNRQSVSDPYMTTPPRAHPLSQEVSRPKSPQPYQGAQGYEEPPTYHFPDALTIARPQPLPQSPRARHSIAAIRQPGSPFATNQLPSPSEKKGTLTPGSRATPTRKEVGSRPTPPGSELSRSSVPFSPDSFDAYNPAARSSQLDSQPSPHNPYHIPEDPKRAASSGSGSRGDHDPSQPIVGYNGRVIDPSDHLPVDSWAPEPEVKTPTRSYAGSSHGFGPRSVQPGQPTEDPSKSRRRSLFVNVRSRDGTIRAMPSSPAANSPASPGNDGRNRLMKRNSPVRSSPMQNDSPSVLREIDPPNPYASSAYGSPHGRGGYMSDHASEYGGQPLQLPPPKPPKIPLQSGDEGNGNGGHGYGSNALSREMAKIDIGGIGAGRRPPRGAAVGMRYS